MVKEEYTTTGSRGTWYNNKVACTVVSKSSELFLGKYYVINAVTDNGMKVEFCAKPELLFEKVA